MALDGQPRHRRDLDVGHGDVGRCRLRLVGGVGDRGRASSTSTPPRRTRLCPGTYDPSWTLIQSGVPGPIVFTTPYDETTTAPGDVLGLCQPDGSVVHYRGSIRVLSDATGVNRTVNETYLQNYLRGVVPREVPATWGNAGGGAGMNACGRSRWPPGPSASAEPVLLRQDVRHGGLPGVRRHRRTAGPVPNDGRDHARAALSDRAVAETGGGGAGVARRPGDLRRVLRVARPAQRRRAVPGRRRSGRQRPAEPEPPVEPHARRAT